MYFSFREGKMTGGLERLFERWKEPSADRYLVSPDPLSYIGHSYTAVTGILFTISSLVEEIRADNSSLDHLIAQ